jgi:serine/threonine protein phosphatase PrpC
MEEDKAEFEITHACRTDVGKTRDHNEDYALVEIPTPAQACSQGMAFVIADGMGGHQAGEVASEQAVLQTIREYYARTEGDVPTRISQAIQAANVSVYDMAQTHAARAGMGTTIVMAVVLGQQVYVANVGDSRAYLVRHGAITQLTCDHSFVGEQLRAGLLTREQARSHPQRNVITRALGSAPQVQVDVHQGELQVGDVVLLCSDGLTEHVPDELLLAVAVRNDPEPMVDRLIELAKEGGGSDNISVIALRASAPAASPPAASPPATSPPATSPPATSPPATSPPATRTATLLLVSSAGRWLVPPGTPTGTPLHPLTDTLELRAVQLW